MAEQIVVPPLGEQKQTDTLLNHWYVTVGQEIQEGDDLAELVTDKASFDIPAPSAGTIKAILVEAGQTVTEGQAIVELE